MAAPLHTPSTGVVITGGASGIGRACAEAVAEVGRPVAIWDLDGEGAAKVAEQIASAFAVATHAEGFDVSDTSAFLGAAERSREALASIGGLVHAAGVIKLDAIDELTEDSWDAVLSVHLRPLPFLVKTLLPDLRAHAGSAIVAIASIDAIIAESRIASYCASKAGMLGVVRSLAAELGRDGIRANSICPGFIDTPMLASALVVGELRERMVDRAMLGRVAQPEEIGRVARFLLSDDASFMTAAEIVVDGGVTRSH